MFTQKMKNAMVEDWYAGLRQEELRAKYQVTEKQLNGWLADAAFARRLDELARASALETRCILARYGPVAAARLVQLLEADKPDVVRRAALDMIGAVLGPAAGETAEEADAGPSETEAREMLRKLASGFGGDKADADLRG